MLQKQQYLVAMGAAALLLAGQARDARADGISVTRPAANAIVRETVQIRVASRDLPLQGYVSIDVDGQFVSARVLPQGNAPVYEWDTKAPYTTPDDPDTKKFIADGSHTVTVSVYTNRNQLVGSQTVPVRIANKIPSVAARGVTLLYKWRLNDAMYYDRTTDLSQSTSSSAGTANGVAIDDATTPATPIESSKITFKRSVEDTEADNFLIRDLIRPLGVLTRGVQAQAISVMYPLKSEYRTVTQYGDVLSTMAPLGPGAHFSFSIPVMPARRVTIGDSWRSPLQVSLDWATTKPLTVSGESRLESFEWQNGYPTAKIRETYDGTAHFPVNPASSFSGATAEKLHVERIVFFAYNSGRLIRTQTVATYTGDAVKSTGLSSPYSGGSRSGGGYPAVSRPGGSSPAGSYPGSQGGNPGASYGSPFGGPSSSSDDNGANPYGGYPGGRPGSSAYGVPAVTQTTTMKFTEVTNVIP